MGIPKASWAKKRSHGKTNTPEYRAWKNMKSRYYHNTSGKGIIVCPQWINNFEHFLADVGLRPSDKHSLGRIDNDGNYAPGNVEWRTS